MKRLVPSLKDYIWGGSNLKELYGKDNGAERISESWEVSVHPDGESRIDDGRTLAAYIAESGIASDELPVLIKYIDAKSKLSVQVHPKDAYARANENDNGKTELWYIIDAEPNAGIYCGFKKDTAPEEFRAKLADGSVEELLNFIPVKKGDCYLIEAGTVHAICEGCLICEMQQSSNVTYRVYDYGRLGVDGKPRELHTKKAMKVINFKAFRDRTFSGEAYCVSGGRMRTLTSCKYFFCKELELDGEYSSINKNSFTAINVIEGTGVINGEHISAGDSFFVPTGEEYTLSGKLKAIITEKSNASYYAGIDLGGTFIKCGIVDSEGRLIAKTKAPTNQDPQKAAEDMARMVTDLAERENIKLSGIGIGAPGTIDGDTGCVMYSNNLGWHNVNLAGIIGDITGLPVAITNDANAAALGEYAYSEARRYKNVVFVTLGTGVGSGIIIDGRLYEGYRGAGAEIGHTIIKVGGEKCTCGARGCLEAYASVTALMKQAKAKMRKDRSSLLWELCKGDEENLNGIIFFDAVRGGDKSAEAVLKKYLSYLSSGLISMANLLRPEAIIIGGGISAEGDLIIKPLQAILDKDLFGGSELSRVEVIAATLSNDAGIFGAARLLK